MATASERLQRAQHQEEKVWRQLEQARRDVQHTFASRKGAEEVGKASSLQQREAAHALSSLISVAPMQIGVAACAPGAKASDVFAIARSRPGAAGESQRRSPYSRNNSISNGRVSPSERPHGEHGHGYASDDGGHGAGAASGSEAPAHAHSAPRAGSPGTSSAPAPGPDQFSFVSRAPMAARLPRPTSSKNLPPAPAPAREHEPGEEGPGPPRRENSRTPSFRAIRPSPSPDAPAAPPSDAAALLPPHSGARPRGVTGATTPPAGPGRPPSGLASARMTLVERIASLKEAALANASASASAAAAAAAAGMPPLPSPSSSSSSLSSPSPAIPSFPQPSAPGGPPSPPSPATALSPPSPSPAHSPHAAPPVPAAPPESREEADEGAIRMAMLEASMELDLADSLDRMTLEEMIKSRDRRMSAAQPAPAPHPPLQHPPPTAPGERPASPLRPWSPGGGEGALSPRLGAWGESEPDPLEPAPPPGPPPADEAGPSYPDVASAAAAAAAATAAAAAAAARGTQQAEAAAERRRAKRRTGSARLRAQVEREAARAAAAAAAAGAEEGGSARGSLPDVHNPRGGSGGRRPSLGLRAPPPAASPGPPFAARSPHGVSVPSLSPHAPASRPPPHAGAAARPRRAVVPGHGEEGEEE